MEPAESFELTQEELERAINRQLNPFEEQQKLLEIASFEPLKLIPKKTKRPREDDEEEYVPRKAHAGRLECDLCGKRFSYYRSFRQHRIDHQYSAHEVECAVCHKMIKPAALNYHMNYKHTEERRFQCKLCGRRFKSPGAMRHHETTQHGDAEMYQYECKECQRYFENNQFLEAHIKAFHIPSLTIKIEKVECEYCHESFANASQLRLHVGVLGKLGKFRNTIRKASKS